MNHAMDATFGPAGDRPEAPPLDRPVRPLYWSVRRELWENRSIWMAPLAVAAVALFASTISVMVTGWKMQGAAGAAAAAGAASPYAFLIRPFRVSPAPAMLAGFIVAVFYALEALHGERRDRSLLFWKSMPVSDATTVLSKAAIPLVVLPGIGLALGIIQQWALLFVGTATAVAAGIDVPGLWAQARPVQSNLVMLYGLTVHALWFSPVYAWLLMVSAWARRLPVVWAVVPPLAVAALEWMLFSTSHFASFLGWRVTGAMRTAFVPEARDGHVDRFGQLDPAGFLLTPGLWLGLAAAALFLLAAVRLRRDREPI
jgi:ABC-2 type transport system permease protein